MEIVDRIIEELRPLADKLGEGAEFLWRTLMLQIYVRGIVSAILCLTIIGLYIKFVPRAYKAFRDGGTGVYSWTAEKTVGCWGVFGGGIATALSFIFLITYSIPRLINPAYYALHEILRTIT